MEKEQIIKALECCSTPSGKRCEYCPKVTEDALCMYRLSGDALALIKELSEENERLKTATEEAVRSFTRLETLYKIEYKRADAIKADTVREFAERFKELMGGELASCGFCNARWYWSVQTVKNCIDRIADEILNKNTEE